MVNGWPMPFPLGCESGSDLMWALRRGDADMMNVQAKKFCFKQSFFQYGLCLVVWPDIMML
jgi:hypothetical protein